MKLCMFRTVRLSIISSLFTVHSAMVYVIQLSIRTRLELSSILVLIDSCLQSSSSAHNSVTISEHTNTTIRSCRSKSSVHTHTHTHILVINFVNAVLRSNKATITVTEPHNVQCIQRAAVCQQTDTQTAYKLTHSVNIQTFTN